MSKIYTILITLTFLMAGNLKSQTIYSEDFEGGIVPSDWQITTDATDGGWKVGTAAALSSSDWTLTPNESQNIIATNDDLCNCDKNQDYLIMPPIDMTNQPFLSLEADIQFGAQSYQGSGEIGTIEVSTDNMETWTILENLHGHGGWDKHIVDLSEYSGQDAVHVAFHYADNGGWLYGLAIDNVKLVVPLSLDVELIELASKIFAETKDEISIKGSILNNGVTEINELQITYQVEGENPVVEILTNINIMAFQYYSFTLPTAWIPSTEGLHNITVEVNSVNGLTDENTMNNKLDFDIEIYPKIEVPNIIDTYIDSHPVLNTMNSSSDQLNKPTDLDFFPILGKNELWVINQRIENIGGSTTTFYDTGEDNQTSLHRIDGNSWHFMSLPTAISFSDNGNFGTSTGVQDANHGGGTFTGPTLWSSDPAIYAQPSGGNGSHMDMLHGSPYCMGITNEIENIFWLFDGWNNEIVRYDFVADHGPGNDNHSDGIIRRYKDFTVKRDGDVPSHLVLDKSKKWLYIVDNGNDRILRLDITSGEIGATIPETNESLAEHSAVNNTTWEVIVDSGLDRPCGIEIMENRLMVSDYATGDIIIYDVDNNFNELGRIETGEPGITGIKVGPNGNLWYTNRINNSLMKIDVGNPVATDSFEQLDNIQVSPNPTSGILNIKMNSSSLVNIEYRLFNLNGQNLLSGSIEHDNHKLDLSNLPKGTYTLNLFNDVNSSFKKIILD